jgi:hypothetical protein
LPAASAKYILMKKHARAFRPDQCHAPMDLERISDLKVRTLIQSNQKVMNKYKNTNSLIMSSVSKQFLSHMSSNRSISGNGLNRDRN